MMFARLVPCQHKFDQMASKTFIVIGQKDRLSRKSLKTGQGRAILGYMKMKGSTLFSTIRYSVLNIFSVF